MCWLVHFLVKNRAAAARRAPELRGRAAPGPQWGRRAARPRECVCFANACPRRTLAQSRGSGRRGWLPAHATGRAHAAANTREGFPAIWGRARRAGAALSGRRRGAAMQRRRRACARRGLRVPRAAMKVRRRAGAPPVSQSALALSPSAPHDGRQGRFAAQGRPRSRGRAQVAQAALRSRLVTSSLGSCCPAPGNTHSQRWGEQGGRDGRMRAPSAAATREGRRRGSRRPRRHALPSRGADLGRLPLEATQSAVYTPCQTATPVRRPASEAPDIPSSAPAMPLPAPLHPHTLTAPC